MSASNMEQQLETLSAPVLNLLSALKCLAPGGCPDVEWYTYLHQSIEFDDFIGFGFEF